MAGAVKPARVRPLACALLPAALALAHAACSTSNSSSASLDVTNIYANPLSFLGDVPCGPYEGALQSYVVTLIDQTDGLGVTLPSSPPTPCTQYVGFSDQIVVIGHAYAGAIDAYDLPVCGPGPSARACLAPYGGYFNAAGEFYSSGSRTMALVEPDDAIRPDSPAWRPLRLAQPAWGPISCAPVTARQLASTPLPECGPPFALRGDRGGDLVLSLDSLRAPSNLACAGADAPDGAAKSLDRVVVEYTRVVADNRTGAAGPAAVPNCAPGGGGSAGGAGAAGNAGGGAGGGAGAGGGDAGGAGGSAGARVPPTAPREAACAPDAKIRYTSCEVEPDVTYAFDLVAYDGDGVLRWSTTCEGTPVRGISNEIACEPLSDDATLVVPFATLRQAYRAHFGFDAPACDAPGAPGLAVQIALAGQGPLQGSTCDRDLRFDGLVPGAYTLRGTFSVPVAGSPSAVARAFVCEGYARPTTRVGDSTGDETASLSCLFL